MRNSVISAVLLLACSGGADFESVEQRVALDGFGKYCDYNPEAGPRWCTECGDPDPILPSSRVCGEHPEASARGLTRTVLWCPVAPDPRCRNFPEVEDEERGIFDGRYIWCCPLG